MSRITRTVVTTGMMMAAVGVGRIASAQVDEPIKFTTTFPFTAGRTQFPAGSYTVRPLEIGNGVMEISNGSEARYFVVESTGPARHGSAKDEIVFKKSDEHYVLSQIWDGAEGSGVQTVPAKAHVHGHASANAR
jgi:hypothetical protein